MSFPFSWLRYGLVSEVNVPDDGVSALFQAFRLTLNCPHHLGFWLILGFIH